MTHKPTGPQAKTRSLFSRRSREKTTVNKMLEEFEIGRRVLIKIDPSVQKGRPFRRFYGKSGVIVGKRGNSYIVKIKDGNKEKEVISLPVHLRSI
ncbi:MAG: 50S ribosomal protein L21e [Candidatus Aenigmatarchaeota archaeon]